MIVNEYTLAPGEYACLPHDTRGASVYFAVFAMDRVNAYLVDSKNLELYRRGETFKHCGPGSITSFQGFVRVPAPGRCFAVIENTGANAIRVAANLMF